MPSERTKNTLAASVRGTISFTSPSSVSCEPGTLRKRQRKLSNGTKNVEIRHREARSTVRANTGQRFKENALGKSYAFFLPDSRLRARIPFRLTTKLIREPGCVGKMATPATTCNSRFAGSFPRLAGIFTGKMLQKQLRHPDFREP
uniref:Uncharacterized protein n=1 Tax=Fagus sylvatica TaxID=28930 RepID=A0A2N9HPL5_FAGSY